MPKLPERIQKMTDFLLVIERYKTIERHHATSNLDRPESDAEHSWHLAMFGWLLVPEIDPTLDQLRLVKMLLMHDLVEIYTGDVSAYDAAGRIGKAQREADAAEKLFSQLPPILKQETNDLFREFEAGTSPESRLAQSLDKLQPIFQNIASGGHMWRELGLTAVRVDEHKRRYLVDQPLLLGMYEHLMERATKDRLFEVQAGNITESR